MNRYEIIIGKTPPPEPPEPPKVREILVGKRSVGKTAELIHSIRVAVERGSEPIVCVYHKPDYMLQRLGDLRHRVRLITAESLRRECLAGAGFKEFYYDDFDLINIRKTAHEGRFGLDKFGLDRRYVELDEMVLTCDTQEMKRFCQETGLGSMPSSIRAGFNNWKVVELPRRSNDMLYTFNNAYMGEFV